MTFLSIKQTIDSLRIEKPIYYEKMLALNSEGRKKFILAAQKNANNLIAKKQYPLLMKEIEKNPELSKKYNDPSVSWNDRLDILVEAKELHKRKIEAIVTNAENSINQKKLDNEKSDRLSENIDKLKEYLSKNSFEKIERLNDASKKKDEEALKGIQSLVDEHKSDKIYKTYEDKFINEAEEELNKQLDVLGRLNLDSTKKKVEKETKSEVNPENISCTRNIDTLIKGLLINNNDDSKLLVKALSKLKQLIEDQKKNIDSTDFRIALREFAKKKENDILVKKGVVTYSRVGRIYSWIKSYFTGAGKAHYYIDLAKIKELTK